MKAKRTISLILAAIMTMTMCACVPSEDGTTTTQGSESTTTAAETTTAAPETTAKASETTKAPENLTGPDADGKFSIAIIPDTQQEVLANGISKGLFANRSRWLAENSEKFDLRYVIHTGDVVNWGDADESQLVVASDAMKILDDAGIPVIYSLGNHDTAAVGVGGSAADPSNTKARLRDTTAFNKYFSTTRYPDLITREKGKVDNAYVLFEAGGVKWMILSLELWPRTEVIEWANTVVEAHPNHNVIVSTHSYIDANGNILSSNGGYGANSPIYLFNTFIKKHVNIKMVFSGHAGQSAVGTSKGVNGNKIVNILGCFHANNQNPVRILEIDVKNGTISGTLKSPIDNTNYSQYNFTQSGLDFIK